MLRLLASAPEDGWAFVQSEGEILLVRPPYQQWAVSHVTSKAVERAVQHHGFVAQENVFSNWQSLISHLHEEVLELRRRRGQGPPDKERIRRLVRRAPRHILADFLHKVASELLPNGEWKAALDLLTHLLTADSVRNDSELYSLAISLLERCNQVIARHEVEKRELIDQEKDFRRKFPRLAETHRAEDVIEYSQAVAQQHQVFVSG